MTPARGGVRSRFVSKLRRLLAHSCLDALEPDLVVLDEFQRFRELLNPSTTSGELAPAPVRVRGRTHQGANSAAVGDPVQDVHTEP